MAKKITLGKLIERATGNKVIGQKRLFRPSDFYKLINDPFWIWCEYNAPEQERKEEADRHRDLLMKKGEDFEKEWVRKTYPGALEVKAKYGIEAIKETLSLMLKGVEVIYKPHLCFLKREIYGKGDLLVKSKKASSNLGDFCYTVKEIKHSEKIQNYHKFQVGVYNLVLGVIQGFIPPEANIILKNTEEKVLYREVEEKMNNYLGDWQDIRDNKTKPEPKGIDETESPWRIYANKILMENHDLTLLPDIGPTTRETIRKKLKIKNLKELEKYQEKELINLLGPDLGKRLFYYSVSYRLKKPIPKNDKIKLPHHPKRVFYFDFETSDDVHFSEPPHVYLIGLWDKEKNKYISFLGRGEKDEKRIFLNFLNYLGNLNEVCLYHWADFEIGEIEKIINQYPELTLQLVGLKNACVDFKEVVKNSFYLPVPSYSIKKVAPFLGFFWRQEEVNAFESMVLYWEWLKKPEQKIIDKVLKYNEDDCRAMAYIEEKLFGKEENI